MKDILGYERPIHPNGQIYSSEFATLTIGSRVSLVQSVNASYGQVVTPKFEAGSAALYFLMGQPMGQVSAARLVGRGGFFSAFGAIEDSCAKLLGLKIGLDGKGGCSAVPGGDGSTLNLDGAVVSNITASFGAGSLEVQEGVTLQVASMRKG
jgi:hypothetical protein